MSGEVGGGIARGLRAVDTNHVIPTPPHVWAGQRGPIVRGADPPRLEGKQELRGATSELGGPVDHPSHCTSGEIEVQRTAETCSRPHS